MSDVPLITIGILAYNAEETIARAIDSAAAQDWPHLEFVIYDDCSTDKTREILKERAAQDNRITLILQGENCGAGTGRSEIISAAKGDFLAFFDDDDVSDSLRLKKQYQRITTYEREFADGAPVACYCARTQHYPDGTSRYEPTIGTAEGVIAPHGPDVARRILYGKKIPQGFGSMASCSMMARLSAFRLIGGYDPAFRRGQDTEFNIRFALAGGHFAGLAEPLVTQEMTLSVDKNLDRERICQLALFEKHAVFLKQDGVHAHSRQWIDAKFDYVTGQKNAFIKKMLRLFMCSPVQTIKRIYWAMPNMRFNRTFKKYHGGSHD